MRTGWLAASFVLAVTLACAGAQQTTNSQTTKQATPQQAATPTTSQSETTNNTAGSIAGNAGAIGSTPGNAKPSNPNVQQNSAEKNNAPQGNSTPTVENTPSAASARATTMPANPPNGASLGITPDADSQTLQNEINSALKSDPTLSNAQLNVVVNSSTITLSGSVPTGKEKVAARRITQSYAANRRVDDKVSVAGKMPGNSSQQPNAMGANTATPKR